MAEARFGRSIGAKLARSLLEQAGNVRDAELEGSHGPSSRHQVYLLSDGRVVDVFLKSARLYASKEEFLRAQKAR